VSLISTVQSSSTIGVLLDGRAQIKGKIDGEQIAADAAPRLSTPSAYDTAKKCRRSPAL
jgi:hypothetical protein